MDGRILSVNDAVATKLGLSIDQMMDHKLAESLPPSARGAFDDYLAAISITPGQRQ